MNRRSKALVAVAVAVPMVLAGTGAAYATHYQDRALPGTSVSGVAVAGMTRDEATAVLEQRAADLTVTVVAGGTTSTEHLADLGYRVDVAATVDAAFAHREWSSYATSLVSANEVPAVVTADEAAVDAVVTRLVERSDKVGKDAAVRLAKNKKSFTVTPAVVGQTVDPASFQDVVEQAARTLTPATATVRFVDVVPGITTADATKVADAANALVGRKVVLSDGAEKHAASAARKASWVTFDGAGKGALGSPTLDPAKVTSWVQSLAKEAKTDPAEGLRYVDAAGTVRLVKREAQDGREVTNAAALSTAAVKAVSAGKSWTGTFAYDTVPGTWAERTIAAGAESLAYPAAEGEKWVDVNLSRHTMTAYVGAKAVYGPIAMVSGGEDFPTVTGTYNVYYKNPLMTMKGTNADGTTYETKDVPWATFFYRGIALHGAYWRDSFGYTGSHGCVNLPVESAKWIYDFAPVGTPVASHY